MNRAKKTAQKRRALLKYAATCSPEDKNPILANLGAWALRIWQQGIGFHKRAEIARAAGRMATDEEARTSGAKVIEERKGLLTRLAGR